MTVAVAVALFGRILLRCLRSASAYSGLLDVVVGGNGDGLVVSGFFRHQTGGLTHPFHVQGIHLDPAAGHGEGRRLTT